MIELITASIVMASIGIFLTGLALIWDKLF